MNALPATRGPRRPAAPGGVTAAAMAVLAAPAWAHEGHGMSGVAHWHATDVIGVVLAVVAAAGALWWMRRK